MKKLIYIFIYLLIGCSNFEDDFTDDLKGDATITGQVSYRDNLSGPGELRRMAGQKVYIAYPTSDSVNYLYYAVTDAQGNFTFKRLQKDADYLIFINDTISDVHYSTYITQKAPSENVTLTAENDTVKQKGMLFYVLNSEKQPVKGVKVRLYNNREIFLADSTDVLSIKEETTDMYGRVIFYNYNAGTYYLRAKFTSTTGLISADSMYNFKGKGISYDTILLKTSLAVKNTVLIKVTDESGNLLPGIACCIFNNPLLFNQESCEGHYLKKSSETDGTIRLTNQLAGSYYIYAQASLNNFNYKAKVTSNVSAAGETIINVVMKKSTPNELLVRTFDEAGNILPNISFCIFNNPLLFNQENCNGNFREGITATNGTVKLPDLPAGSYYLYSEFKQGNIQYKAKATTIVNATGETSIDMVLKKVTPSSELEITVKDNAGTPVNGTKLYFFTSRNLWAADTTLGSIRDVTTENNGKITILNMEEGKYYIRARVVFGGQVLMKGADSVTIINAPVKISKAIYVQ